MSWINLYHLIT